MVEPESPRSLGGPKAPTPPTPPPLRLDVGPAGAGAVFADARERSARRLQGLPLGVETPFRKLNEILGGGFQPGQTYILGAPPGCGKSALALLFSRHVVAGGGRAGYLAYEVSPKACRARALCDIASLKGDDLQAGRFDPDALETYGPELVRQTGQIAFVDATADPRPTAAGITEAVLMLNTSGDPFGFLLVVDYLQLAARFAGYDFERDVRGKVALFSNDLAQIARRCSVPVLALSSVGRAAYKDPKNLAAFKEAGDIESDADVAMLIGPRDGGEDAWEDLRGKDDWPLSLNVLKNRHGKTGTALVTFHRPFMRFTEG